MIKLLFLGTGPANGTRVQVGKSKRLESSVLIHTEKGNILIDVTQFFNEQKQHISSVDAILITHAHLDAIGGLGEFIKFSKKKVTLFCLKQVEQKIRKHFPGIEKYILFEIIHPYQKVDICGLSIVFTPVRHSIQKGYPTVGFFCTTEDKKTFYYASDVASWSMRTEKYMRKAETLIIDGAMWYTVMPAHLTINTILPKLCAWENKKIIFTQIGNTAPQHEDLEKEIHTMCPKALPAYDGMYLMF